MTNSAILLAVGDVGSKRADPASIFRGCRDVLRGGDVVFAQLETTVTDRGAQAPNAKLAMRAPPSMAAAVRDTGINVMSFAGNHCLDWGYEGFADTLSHMADAGIVLCGAGANIAAAREPAIVEHNGLRFAFLAYSSILPEGYRAERAKPGCAPMRAHTFYEQVEHDQPGTPARTISYAHREDLTALVADILAAKELAEIVVVSMHWGIHMVEATIADYQREIAYAAIDAGADAIIGHHPHILKGVEYYRGAPIFYSLGNFAIEQPHVWDPAIIETDSFRHLVSLNPTWNRDAIYMLPRDTRMTGVVRLHCTASGIERTEFLPAWIEDDSAPVMLGANDPRFMQAADYLARISKSEKLNVRIEPYGDVLRLRSV